MPAALIILPHQLFADHPALEAAPEKVVLVEDPLFFGDPAYPARFHAQKLWLHRASMAQYAARLRGQGHEVRIAPYARDTAMVAQVISGLAGEGVDRIVMADPVDMIAERRIRQAADAAGLILSLYDTPGFLNTPGDNSDWAEGRKRWFMAEFYKSQRRRLDVLMEGDDPKGRQWSFDEENRKKVPKAKLGDIPALPGVVHDDVDRAARDSVRADFPEALGAIETLIYPTTHEAAADWLGHFLRYRFDLFGPYEDAIVEGESWLWHAVLTPMLNIGLLTPRQVLDATLEEAAAREVPIASLEGFIRQVIGWREFMRATYEDLGVKMRTTNHWGHTRAIPDSFYDGTTGIDPIDDTIKRLLETGYCHHIERLMVLGGFMFLCEFDPDDVYRWFMEMFVDSYDWVMVPNVYAMSQHADGGQITTKPYFSGSNYVRKMSHWPKGDWAATWDGLYWRFIFKHAQALGNNPRWAMMCRTAARMKEETREGHLKAAEAFLKRL